MGEREHDRWRRAYIRAKMTHFSVMAQQCILARDWKRAAELVEALAWVLRRVREVSDVARVPVPLPAGACGGKRTRRLGKIAMKWSSRHSGLRAASACLVLSRSLMTI